MLNLPRYGLRVEVSSVDMKVTILCKGFCHFRAEPAMLEVFVFLAQSLKGREKAIQSLPIS